MTGSKAAQGKLRLEDISDDSDDPFEEDLADTESADEEELIADDEEDLLIGERMPVTPARTPASARKKPNPPRSAAKKLVGAPMEDLTNKFSQMAVAKQRVESKHCHFPWFCFQYKANGGRDHTTIRIHGLCRPKSHFKISVVSGGKMLELRVRISDRLYSKPMNNAILLALGILHDLSGLKNAFEAMVGDITKSMEDKKRIWSDPMHIPLPFECEEQVVQWDVIFTPVNIEELTDEVGGQQFDAIVHVELRSTYVNVDNEQVATNRVVMLDEDNDMDV